MHPERLLELLIWQISGCRPYGHSLCPAPRSPRRGLERPWSSHIRTYVTNNSKKRRDLISNLTCRSFQGHVGCKTRLGWWSAGMTKTTPEGLWQQHCRCLLSCSLGLNRSRRAEVESIMESRHSPASESSPGDSPLLSEISSNSARASSWSTGQCCIGV